MANPEHLEILKKGVKVWNKWRRKHKDVLPDLRGADLRDANFSRTKLSNAYLRYVNLKDADISGANLRDANLRNSNLRDADLRDAKLSRADPRDAVLSRAVLKNANLDNAHFVFTEFSYADLSGATLILTHFNSVNLKNANLRSAHLGGTAIKRTDLSGANLSGAYITDTHFNFANLDGVDLTEAYLGVSSFINVDLSQVIGLETVIHIGPSNISIDTIYQSQGNISKIFLSKAGVPDNFITYMRSLTTQPIHFYSCFISYSHKDEDFARRLYSSMRDADLRVWYAPEEMRGGQKLHEQIFNAIHIHDKLLLVLSENSLQSEWVMTEIRRARKAEREEKRRKLFPIRLVDFNAIQKWECFDTDSGKDLGVELREYFIPDFSNWKDHDAFELAFDKLLRDLKAEA
jgi:uncharacterized protein YjbI with pentapeptide repeats